MDQPLLKIKLTRNQWIAIGVGVGALAIAAFFYGITQLRYNKEHDATQTITQQYNEQRILNQNLLSQIATQTQQFQAMQNQFDQFRNKSVKQETTKSGVTVITKYDPITGKMLEQIVKKLNEVSHSTETVHIEDHYYATTTVVTQTTATATTQSVTSDAHSIQATATVVNEVHDAVKIQSAGGSKSDMRFSLGAAYHKNRVNPVTGYTVKGLSVGRVISVGPGVVIGKDLMGAALQADILSLPRLGIGYGCNIKGKECGTFYSVGIRLDF